MAPKASLKDSVREGIREDCSTLPAALYRLLYELRILGIVVLQRNDTRRRYAGAGIRLEVPVDSVVAVRRDWFA